MGQRSRGRARGIVIVVGVIALAMVFAAGAQAQSILWRVVQGSDGTLYLLTGGLRFTLQPDAISDDDLAQIPDGGVILSAAATPPAAAGSSTPTLAPGLAGTSPATPVATPPPFTGPAAGTRQSAIPLGMPGRLADGWQLIVRSAEPNATKGVLAQNPSQSAPPSDFQFFVARIQVTYVGSGAQMFQASSRLRTVGPSLVPYLAFANSCGAIPDPIAETEVTAGQTIVGNVCWTVQSKDAADLVLYDAPPGRSADTTRTYFALHR